MTTRILALNPFHTGSHRSFLEGWAARSRHEFTVLSLPGTHWKWRMRHSAASLAFGVNELESQTWDVVFATDLLNLAEFRGLVSQDISRLPTVLYFHENQFAYPSRGEHTNSDRDLHFALTNLVSLLAADAIWFNSQFNRESLFAGIESILTRVPKLGADDRTRWSDQLLKARSNSFVHSPGVDPIDMRDVSSGKIHLLWVARWEHDKNPEQFFESLRSLRESGVEFRLSVLGESFRNVPECFAQAKVEFSEQIEHWGYAESKVQYRSVLSRGDVVVSTARHEFFGIAVVEAMTAGCIPVLPDKLSYPELVQRDEQFLYNDSSELVRRLQELSVLKSQSPATFQELRAGARSYGMRFDWDCCIASMDDAIADLVDSRSATNHDL